MISRIKAAWNVLRGTQSVQRFVVEEPVKPVSLAYLGLPNKVYVNENLLITKICDYPSQEFVAEIEEMNQKNREILRIKQEQVIEKYGYEMQKDGKKIK